MVKYWKNCLRKKKLDMSNKKIDKIKCPSCDVELDEFISSGDLILSNGNMNILSSGRLHIKCCTRCQYTDEKTAWFE